MDRIRNVFAKCFVAAVTVVLCFSGVECAVRYYLRHHADPPTFFRYASLPELQARLASGQSASKWSVHPYLGFYPTPGLERGPNRHTQSGFRGADVELPKPEGRFRIACLGGSTTYTTAVEDHRAAYPAVLEELLRAEGYDVDVVNGGSGKWTTWESLISFQLRVLELDPDLVVVFHGINDLETRFVWPPVEYRGDNTGVRSAEASEVFMPGWLEHSAALRALLIKTGRATPHLDLATTLARPRDTFYGDDFRRQKRQGSYPTGIFAEVSASEMLAANTDRHFQRNIESLVASANARGIDVVLATFDYLTTSPSPILSSDEYKRGIAEQNHTLAAVAASGPAHLFDYAKEFPEDPALYADGVHVNEKGARRKAELFAAFLVESGLLSK